MKQYSKDGSTPPIISSVPRNCTTRPKPRWATLWVRACLTFLLLVPMVAMELRAEEAKGPTEAATCQNDYSQCFKELLPIQEMRTTAYTKAFAERFGLEPPAPGTEPDNGLEAMELRVQRTREWTNLYSFTLSLYIDSRLPVKLPEAGSAGNLRMLHDASHFFGGRQKYSQWMKWPEEDRRYINRLNGGYSMKAFLATMDYVPGKKGAFDSIEYEEFHAELLPGLTYIQLMFGCSPLILSKPQNNIGIFLYRAKETGEIQKIYTDNEKFIKFTLPNHIIKRMKEWSNIVEPINNETRKRELTSDINIENN